MIHEKQFARAGGARSLYRACVMRAIRVGEPSAANRWPEDPVVDMVLRAAVNPTSLTDVPELGAVVTEFVSGLAPYSAAAALFGLATALSFGNAASIAVSGMHALAVAQWVREGAPIPVVQGLSTRAILTPAKIAVIVPLSNEMMRSGNAEAMMRDALAKNVSPSLDRYLFDDLPGVPGLRPPGLRNGVAASTPVSTGPNPNEAMAADIETLVAALAAYAGNGNIALVASPKHAIRMMMHGFLAQKSPFPLLIADQPNLIAVAASALAVAIDPPLFSAGGDALMHMEDTNPLPIVDNAGVVATPVRSTWQTDSVGLRFIQPVSWALRAPAVRWLLPTAW